MLKKLIYSFNLFLLFLFCANPSNAQTSFSSETELKKHANELFDKEDYAEAFSLYSQLLSVYPKDPNYNYKFGICMLYTSENKEKPISYLEYASKQPDVDKDVFFFLGKAYHVNYRFDDAIKAYNKFKMEASTSQQKKMQVDAQIDMCRNGKSLLKNITDLQVLEKKQLSEVDFFRSYDLSSIGGKLLVKPEDFQSSIDKKAKQQTIIYLAANNNQIYYSSFGTDGKNGKDIYVVKKQADGEWSAPTSLGSTINTPFDEDYPFLHPNGKVLYFCSKGHNSMGGYDVFKSTLDEQSNTWRTPVNMDFAINTPDDDIMYVTDSLEKTAYFSSKRISPSGKIDVYKISTERRPVELAVINGNTLKDDVGFIKSKITVKNASNGELIGMYNNDPQTGSYNLSVPGGSKLLFTVESEGYATQSEVVVLPYQKAFKPFRQEISYEAITNKLKIENFFDDAVDDNSYLLALNFIKEKAKMEVNANEAMLREQRQKEETQVATTDDAIATEVDSTSNWNNGNTTSNITNAELVKIAQEDAEDIQEEAKELKNQAKLALNYAGLKNEEAQEKYNQANEQTKLGNTSAATELRKEADKISRETVAAFNLANKLEADAVAKQNEADLSLNYAQELEAASKTKNSSVALTQLEEQKKRIESLSSEPKGADNAYNNLKLEAESKQNEANRVKERSAILENEIPGIDVEIAKQEQAIVATDNEQLKEGLRGEINGLKEDKVKKQTELAANRKKIVALEKQSANLKNEAEIVSRMIDQIKTGGEAPATTASIDKQKLQEQVNGYQMDDEINSTQTNTITESTITQTTATSLTSNTQSESNAIDSTEKTTTAQTAATNETATIQSGANLNTTKTPRQDEAQGPSVNTSYGKKYINKLADADEINDDYTRETTKATYYKNWADSISFDIAEKKYELSETEGEEAKNSLQQTITGLEEEEKLKRKLSETSKAKAKEIITTTPTIVAVNNSKTDTLEKKLGTATVSDTSESQIINTTDTKVVQINNATDSISKVDAEQTVTTNTEAGNDSTTNGLTATAGKATPQQQISNESNQTETVAGEVVEAPGSKQTPITNSPEVVATKTDTGTDAKTTSPSLTGTKETAASPALNSAQNVEKLNKALATSHEADDLIAQAMTLRNVAYAKTDPAEREADLQKANEIEEEALKKQQESAEATAQVKASEFKATDDKLVSYSEKLVANNQADDVMMAEMVRDEAKFYFGEAQKDRERATAASSYSLRKDYLTKAQENEKIAFEKQTQATKLYAQFKPEENIVPDLPATNTEDNSVVASAVTLTPDSVSSNTHQLDDKQFIQNTVEPQTKPVDTKQTPNVKEQQPVVNQQNTPTAQTSANGSLTPEKIQEVKNTMEYTHYVALVAQVDSTNRAAAAYYKIADDFQAQANDKNKEADPILKLIEEVPEGTPVPDSLTNMLNSIKATSTVYQQKADSARASGSNSEEIAKVKKSESELFLFALDEKLSTQIKQVYSGNTTPFVDSSTLTTSTQSNTTPTTTIQSNNTSIKKSAPITSTNNTATKFGQATITLTEGFAIAATSVYSDENPIPINPPLPEGLVYKVQVGAFRKPIPQNSFSGINPLTGETTQSGLIRYTAGLFRDLSPAQEAKNTVVTKGFRDAFVVAFYNGKRISVAQAAGMGVTTNTGTIEANNTTPTDVTSQQTEALQQQPTQNNISATTQQPTIVNNNNSSNSQEVVETADIATVSGVVYTVQVGVYSKPVTKAQLFNISSLYTETLSNGLKRYTSGAYTDINEAINAKEAIVTRGIKDAFIIVYKDGKRVAGNDLAVTNTLAPSQTTETTSGTLTAENIVFKVQIGAYKSEIPVDVANKMLSISSKGVSVIKDTDGKTIYSVGNFKTFDEAVITKAELVNSGISDAFVVAYNKNSRMSLEEAKRMLQSR